MKTKFKYPFQYAMSLKNTKKNKKPSGTNLVPLHEAGNESDDSGPSARIKNKGKGKNRSVVRIKLISET